MKKLNKTRQIGLIVIVVFFVIGTILCLWGDEIALKIQRQALNDDDAYCTLSYPVLNIDIPCFWSYDSTQLQNYVDLDNSAGITGLGTIGSAKADAYIIAEHSTQEFENLTDSKIGDTAYVIFPDGKEITYTVSDCFRGYNTKNNITHSDGTSIVGDNPDLVLYACMEDDYNIWIVLLQIVQ